jgi:HlyD family secretion protein
VGTAAFGRPGGLTGSLLIGLVSFLLGGLAVYLWSRPGPASRPKDDGKTGSQQPLTEIVALGRLEPKGGVIAIYGLPGDRVEKLKVIQGAEVEANQTLTVMASWKDRQQEATLAETQLREAKEQYQAIREAANSKLSEIELEIKQLPRGEEDDVTVQQTKIDFLKASVDQTQRELTRLKSLTASRVPAQDLEKLGLTLESTKSELAAARAVLDKTRHSYAHNRELALAKKKSVETERDQTLLRLPIDSLTKSHELARRRVELTEIKAPVKGTVLAILSHEGEATSSQPILQLAGSLGMVAVAEVYETEIATLYDWLTERGSVVKATITRRGTPFDPEKKPLEGRVTSREQIARMIERNSLFSLNPREEMDRRVIQVRVELDKDSADRARNFVGLQVDVRLQQLQQAK